MDTFARCHAVLYKGYDDIRNPKSRRVHKLQLFRNLEDAIRFFDEKRKEGNAVQLFIEPPLVGGEFLSIDLGEDLT